MTSTKKPCQGSEKIPLFAKIESKFYKNAPLLHKTHFLPHENKIFPKLTFCFFSFD